MNTCYRQGLISGPVELFGNGKPGPVQRRPRLTPAFVAFLNGMIMSQKNDLIKKSAEDGWGEFVKTEAFSKFALNVPKSKSTEFKDLDDAHKFGLYQAVTSIVSNPHAEPYASLMPANGDRKAYRALDDCLRDALGYARFRHGDAS